MRLLSIFAFGLVVDFIGVALVFLGVERFFLDGEINGAIFWPTYAAFTLFPHGFRFFTAAVFDRSAEKRTPGTPIPHGIPPWASEEDTRVARVEAKAKLGRLEDDPHAYSL